MSQFKRPTLLPLIQTPANDKSRYASTGRSALFRKTELDHLVSPIKPKPDFFAPEYSDEAASPSIVQFKET